MDDYIKQVAQNAADTQDELVNKLLNQNGFDPEIYKTAGDLELKGYMLIHTIEGSEKHIKLVKIQDELVFKIEPIFTSMKMSMKK